MSLQFLSFFSGKELTSRLSSLLSTRLTKVFQVYLFLLNTFLFFFFSMAALFFLCCVSKCARKMEHSNCSLLTHTHTQTNSASNLNASRLFLLYSPNLFYDPFFSTSGAPSNRPAISKWVCCWIAIAPSQQKEVYRKQRCIYTLHAYVQIHHRENEIKTDEERQQVEEGDYGRLFWNSFSLFFSKKKKKKYIFLRTYVYIYELPFR